MLSIGAAFLLALGLGYLAAPRVVAELERMPGQAAMDVVESGVRPSIAGLVRAVEAQTASLRVVAQSEPHLSIASLSIALAGSGDLPQSAQEELLGVGRHHLERTLALAPGQPRAWLMLADLRQRAHDSEGAAAALRLSFASNPHIPMFAPFRWPMVLAFGRQLDRETRERANLEFLSYFTQQPEIALRQTLRLDRLAELRALASDDGTVSNLLDRQIKRLERESG